MILDAIVTDINTRLPGVADDVLDRAALCVLDAIACALGGREFDWSEAARATLEPQGTPSSTVWSDGSRHGVLDTIYVNSVMAHSIVQEDMHSASRSHFGTMVVPTVLAVGEARACSGRQVLEALVAGYQAGASIAAVMTTPEFIARGWRPSSTFGPFATAMAAAHLMGLGHSQTVSALGLAGSSAAGTTAWAFGGTPDAYFQNGNAARAGALAAGLAEQGIGGTTEILEGQSGLLHAFAGEPVGSATAAPVGGSGCWAVEEVYFKAFPSCAFTQETVEAFRRLHCRGLRWDEVVSIVIRSYRMGKHYPGCDNASSLQTTLERQMSSQFAAAATLFDGTLDLRRYLEPLPAEIAVLAGKINIEEDAEFEAMFPLTPTVRVEVTTTGGGSLSEEVRGGAYLGPEGVVEKFRGYASSGMADHKVDAFIGAIRGMVGSRSVGELMHHLHCEPHG